MDTIISIPSQNIDIERMFNQEKNDDDEETRIKMSYAINYTFNYLMKFFAFAMKTNQSYASSPFTTICSLSSLIAGSDEQTKDEILSSLYNVDTITEIEEKFMLNEIKFYRQFICHEKDEKIKFSTFLFHSSDVDINEDFISICEQNNLMNIECITDGEQFMIDVEKILKQQAILDERFDITNFDAKTMLLVDCCYIEPVWKYEFKRSEIQYEFYNADGTVSNLSYIHAIGDYRFGFNDHFNCYVFEIPLKWNDMAMVIFLPKDINSVEEFIEEDENSFSDKLGSFLNETNFEMKKIDVWLPEFQIKSKIQMKNFLKSININSVFETENANLSRLISGEQFDENFALENMLHITTFNAISTDLIETGCDESSVDYIMCSCPFMFVITADINEKKIAVLSAAVQNLDEN